MISIKNNFGVIIFLISCVTILPLILDSLRGYMKKKDTAWFFHTLACEITLWEYVRGSLLSLFINKEESRIGWKQ